LPSLTSGHLIKEVRLRKFWQQAQLLYSNVSYTNANLSRVEDGSQKPNKQTFSEHLFRAHVTNRNAPFRGRASW